MAARYASPGKQKRTGAHYTPAPLAGFVADRLVETWAREDTNASPRVLDPSVGDGQLLDSLATALSRRGSVPELFGFDTDPAAVTAASARLGNAGALPSITIERADFLEAAVAPDGAAPFDLVIANPPYVRTQVLGAGSAQKLARRYGLSGRVDLYYAFVEAIARVLRPGGWAGVIVSNRFMTVRAGAALRRHLSQRFEIESVWDLGDTRLFEAAVLPAVLLLRGRGEQTPDAERPARFTSIYSEPAGDRAVRRESPIAALSGRAGRVRLPDGRCFRVRHGTLRTDPDLGDLWRLSTPASERWLRQVARHTHATFGQLAGIRVGVKSTADRVFIRADWDSLPGGPPELLRPLMTHHAARRFRARRPDPERRILYPHASVPGGRVAVDLEGYPRAERYLRAHRETLEARSYVREAGRRWYELWVPHDPAVWKRPKLVFRDIAERPTFWLDHSGAVVNGDCYWWAPPPRQRRLVWLALAVGNSSFIEQLYDLRFNNRLYAGRRRFMTQYVEQFPLPRPDTPLADEIVAATRKLHRRPPGEPHTPAEQRLDGLVWRAFGFDGAPGRIEGKL